METNRRLGEEYIRIVKSATATFCFNKNIDSRQDSQFHYAKASISIFSSSQTH